MEANKKQCLNVENMADTEIKYRNCIYDSASMCEILSKYNDCASPAHHNRLFADEMLFLMIVFEKTIFNANIFDCEHEIYDKKFENDTKLLNNDLSQSNDDLYRAKILNKGYEMLISIVKKQRKHN